MATTDPLADMITRIRNAIAVNKSELSLPHSKNKEQVAQILVANGFLATAKTSEVDKRRALSIIINEAGQSAKITEIDRLSKPGRRWYVGVSQIPVVKRGRGLVVISTSQGMMTGQQAKAKGLGGELICRVY